MPLEITAGPENAPLHPLRGRVVAVLGYGNQGRAHALNLRDSGVSTIVAGRPGSTATARAGEEGFATMSIEEAAARGDLLILALPDEAQPDVWRQRIAPHARPEAVLGFLHGFSVHFGLVAPPPETPVVMVAPKGPGETLRRRYVEGAGIPCLMALRDGPGRAEARAIGLAWANGIGCARAAIIHTTFADETETDLFGEQAVLCGGLSALVMAAFETLVAAGYPAELAYLECCHEVKQVADLIYQRGLRGAMSAVSNTAEFGAYEAGPRVVDERVRQHLRSILQDVRSGAFAQRLRDDYARGFPWFTAQRDRWAEHAIDRAGRRVRRLAGIEDGPG
jgi:ketol-acid reductoisomerase